MSLQTRNEALAAAVGADVKALRSVSTVTTTATLTPNSAYAQYNVTALTGAMAIANPTGSPIDGQGMLIRIKDSGSARVLSWGTSFRAIGITLPLTTVASKLLYVGCKYNAADSKWDVLAVGQEA